MTAPDQPSDDGPSPDTDDTIQTEFDWDSVAPSTAVIQTVSIAANTDPSNIQPLYGSVDPDALDKLIRSNGARSTGSTTSVSFTYAEYEVTLHSTGIVVARPIEEDR